MDIAAVKEDLANWRLSSDQKLLETLQSFSNLIAERSQSCIKKVDELGFEVSESEVSLRNTFNEFLMLGNTQFIENVSVTTTYYYKVTYLHFCFCWFYSVFTMMMAKMMKKR